MTYRKKLGSGIERLELRAAPSTLLGTGISLDPVWLGTGMESKFEAPSYAAKQVASGYVAKVTPGLWSKSDGQSPPQLTAKPQAILDLTFAKGELNGDGAFEQFDIMGALRTDAYVAHANARSSHGHRLTALAGDGEGIVNVSPEGSKPGFSVEIQVAVWNTSPNTLFIVKRAFDFAPDGVCTSNAYIPFPVPNPGPLVELTTSKGGAGATHIKFERPQIADDTQFDVHFEVSTPDASIVLRTECFTVNVK